MLARITPSPLKGTVPAIASKSMAHRLIICAALANGETHVTCNTTCADIEATVRCLTALGARIETVEDGFQVHPTMKSVEFGLLKALAGGTLDCGESGSTLRFMLPVACALGANATFVGQGRLGARPLSPLSDEIIAAGCDLQGLGGFPLKTSGRMRPGTFVLPGNVSSQYISGLLMALPRLSGGSTLHIAGELQSAGYVDMTLDALRLAGVRIEKIHDGFRIPGGQRFALPGETEVEGDWSNAAFFLCAGAFSERGVRVEGLRLPTAQGDSAVLDILRRFGAQAEISGTGVTVRGGALRGIRIDAAQIPDLIPVLAVTAAGAQGETVIENAARLRLKESDRLQSTAELLRRLGCPVTELPDGLIIKGRQGLTGGTVSACGDHRIAMSAAAAAALCTGPVTVTGAESVEKSYPRFWADWEHLKGDTL